MTKKIFYIFIFAIFILSGCAQNKSDLYKSIVDKDKLVVGISFNSKPFGFVDSDGKVKGMEADLAREIADRILGDENKVVFKDVKPVDRIKAVTSGDVDMVISTMTITQQRKKIVDFSSPYFVAGQAICVKSDGKIDSYNDLLNKRVIVILGTTGEKNIRRFAPNALIQGYSDNADAIEAFKNGYGDAITTDDSLLQGLVMDDGGYKILSERLTKEPYGIAFRKSGFINSFKQNIDKVIQEIKYDGTLMFIKDKWGLS